MTSLQECCAKIKRHSPKPNKEKNNLRNPESSVRPGYAVGKKEKQFFASPTSDTPSRKMCKARVWGYYGFAFIPGNGPRRVDR
jgi:hypothetical protein